MGDPGSAQAREQSGATVGSDRRDSYRLDLTPGRAVVTVGAGMAVEVRDLSASGSSLLLRGGSPTGSDRLPALIELDGGETFSTHLEVVRVRPQESGAFELGARFGVLGEDALQKLSRFIAREHHRQSSDPARLLGGAPSLRIANPLFIANLFRNGVPAHDRVMFVVDGNVRLPALLRAERLSFENGKRVIVARCVGDAAALPPGHEYSFVLSGAGAVTVFESVCLRQRGREVLIAVPQEVRQTGFRESPRVPLSSARPADVMFEHPRLAGERISGPVFDVAGRGVSFPVDPAEHALFPGDRLAGLRLNLPDGPVAAEGIVRSIASRPGQDRVSCGVELVDFAGKEDARRWHGFVFRHLHPNLVDGRGRADAAWNVLDSSHYLDLWTPGEHRDHIRRCFSMSWNRPAPDVGQSVVLERADSPVGLTAGSLVYPHTWMFHHLGIDPRALGSQGPLEQVAELFSGILYRVKERTDFHYFLIYVESGKRLNDRIYGDFARRYHDAEKLLYSPLGLFRWSAAAEPPPQDDSADEGDVTIVAANQGLWSRLSQQLCKTLPLIEQRAFAFDEPRIALSSFSDACAGRGHERRREAFFALVGDRPVAALVAETGDEGVNVFGLLNTCRVFPLTAPAPGPGVKVALLRAAIAYFRDAGKRTFLLFEDDPVGDGVPERLGLSPVSGGLRWLAHRDVIPAWTAYFGELLRAQASAPSRAEDGEPLRIASA